jgi:ribosomal protein L11 methyltransferase
MPQVRYHFTAPRDGVLAVYRELETIYEDAGHPLAMIEIDEKARIDELSIYAETDEPSVLETMRDLVAKAGLKVAVETEVLPDIDWVTHSLDALPPVRAGRFLVHGSHDRDKVQPNDVAIEIEAGLAFGTGHHATTALCLEMIGDRLKRGVPKRVLDLGTGSGVLAIALARAAHLPVLATDIDPIATSVARDNARLNHAAGLVHCETAIGLSHPVIASNAPFDLIVANILARPLMALAPGMARAIAPGGELILSGILERQRNAVVAAYSGQRFRHVRTLRRDEWVAIHLAR